MAKRKSAPQNSKQKPDRTGKRPSFEGGRTAGAARKGRGESSGPSLPPGTLFGRHAVSAALANPSRSIQEILLSEGAVPAFDEVVRSLPENRRAQIPDPDVIPPRELDLLLPEGSVHQGWLIRARPLPEKNLEAFLETELDENAFLVVLDQVTDPQNVGAILRSAAAFGAAAVILPDRNAPPETASLAKTASGALDVIPIIRIGNLSQALKKLQEHGFWCVGLAEEGSESLSEARLDGKIAIVMGAEGDGLRRLTKETCDLLVHLPTLPPIGALNVSAAAAVTLYQVRVARMVTDR